MPLTAEQRRARKQKVIDPEPTYIIEAGSNDGFKIYRFEIQYGYDINFFANHARAMREIAAIEAGEKVPCWKGTRKIGKFSARNMFSPVWAKCYQGGLVVWEWHAKQPVKFVTPA